MAYNRYANLIYGKPLEDFLKIKRHLGGKPMKTGTDPDHPIHPVAKTIFVMLVALVAGLYLLHVFNLVAVGIGLVIAAYVPWSIRAANQWEKAVVLRLGKFIGLKGPGWFLIIPLSIRSTNISTSG